MIKFILSSLITLIISGADVKIKDGAEADGYTVLEIADKVNHHLHPRIMVVIIAMVLIIVMVMIIIMLMIIIIMVVIIVVVIITIIVIMTKTWIEALECIYMESVGAR